MSASDYLIEALINHTLRNDPFAQPSAVWLSLHVGDPGGDGDNEASGGSYARVAAPTWSSPASRAMQNTSTVEFGTQSSALGTVTHVGFWDAETGGNFLWSVMVQPNITLGVGSAPTFEAGQITISVVGSASLYLAHAWLSHVFGGSAFTSPGTDIYVGLHTFPPGLTGTGEVSGNDYARVQEDDWDAPSGGDTANASAIEFPTPTGNWGGLSHFSVWDSSASGNVLIVQVLDSDPYPYPAELGDDIAFSVGAITVSVE